MWMNTDPKVNRILSEVLKRVISNVIDGGIMEMYSLVNERLRKVLSTQDQCLSS